MDTARVIVELITSLASLVIQAFEEKDIKKLRRVTDVLDDEPLKLKATLALEQEKAKDAFGLSDD